MRKNGKSKITSNLTITIILKSKVPDLDSWKPSEKCLKYCFLSIRLFGLKLDLLIFWSLKPHQYLIPFFENIYSRRSIIRTFRGNRKKFVISRVHERLYKGLVCQGEQTLVLYIESLHYQGFVLSSVYCSTYQYLFVTSNQANRMMKYNCGEICIGSFMAVRLIWDISPTLAKCKGARERRYKEAGILQRTNGLNLISKGFCLHPLTTVFKRLMSSKPINEGLLVSASVFITEWTLEELTEPWSYILRYILLFLLLETALLTKEINRNQGHCWKISRGRSSVARAV